MHRSPWRLPRHLDKTLAPLGFLALFALPLIAQSSASDSGQKLTERTSHEEIEAGIGALAQREELEKTLIVLRDIRKRYQNPEIWPLRAHADSQGGRLTELMDELRRRHERAATGTTIKHNTLL